MSGRDGAHSLELHDDPAVANQVSDIAVAERLVSVSQVKRLGPFKGYAAISKLDLQTLLMDGFQEPRAHGAIDLERCAANLKRLVLVDQAVGWLTVHASNMQQRS